MNLHLWASQLVGSVVVAEGETPSPRPTFNPEDVGPGIESFLIAFILAVALLGLLWSMSRHLRRVQVRARLNEEARLEAESIEDGAAAEGGAGADAPASSDDDGSAPDTSGPDASGADNFGPDNPDAS